MQFQALFLETLLLRQSKSSMGNYKTIAENLIAFLLRTNKPEEFLKPQSPSGQQAHSLHTIFVFAM